MNALAFQDIAKPGTRWSKATMAAVVARFKVIRKANGGMLTAALVLDDARDEDSPLHRHFEWSDTKAGELWRLEQARKLIQQHYMIVTVRGEEPMVPMRAQVVVHDEEGQQAYVSTVVAMRQESYSAEVVRRARNDMQAWIDRYDRFVELRDAVGAAKEVLVNLAG